MSAVDFGVDFEVRKTKVDFQVGEMDVEHLKVNFQVDFVVQVDLEVCELISRLGST